LNPPNRSSSSPIPIEKGSAQAGPFFISGAGDRKARRLSSL
jgi:hypothetical protein